MGMKIVDSFEKVAADQDSISKSADLVKVSFDFKSAVGDVRSFLENNPGLKRVGTGVALGALINLIRGKSMTRGAITGGLVGGGYHAAHKMFPEEMAAGVDKLRGAKDAMMNWFRSDKPAPGTPDAAAAAVTPPAGTPPAP